jgi:uroporphyrinogen-III synthase
MLGAAVLRPEPGNAATAARLAAAGFGDVLRLPLFAVRPVAWTAPDGADALVLTSANAVRHAGAGLAGLRHLPVLAVGAATAAAARAAGLTVAWTGQGDASALAEPLRRHARPLHLAGREHRALPGVETRVVYASAAVAPEAGALAACAGRVALLHSARAAAAFAGLVDRAGIRVAALSEVVAAAAGPGWAAVAIAAAPTDAALVAAARALAD